jgi:hypothetical protein
MRLANELNDFINMTGDNVFIEAEGKPDAILKFINEYNGKYNQGISVQTDGIIKLQPTANKWGLELRLYLHDKKGAPSSLGITHNNQYRGDYSYRINDISLIKELFELGYRIGLN